MTRGALTTRAHDFLTANDGPNFLRAARALSVHVPPIQRVADVSERIEGSVGRAGRHASEGPCSCVLWC